MRVARLLTLCVAMVCFGFSMGTWFSRHRIERRITDNNEAIAALSDRMARDEMKSGTAGKLRALGTSGNSGFEHEATDVASRDRLVEEIKGQLQREMGSCRTSPTHTTSPNRSFALVTITPRGSL
ncbi:MAG: hypothetical protein ABIS29_02735 [Vicinamibacterales bacterium]